jgi:tRNA threonylcarbamoyladenosine biosynthesis protein TsaE
MERTYTESDIAEIAQQIVGELPVFEDQATVLALQGDLGAGKTTLTKALAQLLGVQEAVASPTFVIAKFYPASSYGFESMVHVDAYRIESEDELAPLGWSRLLQQPKTLLIVEWPEKISQSLPDYKQHFIIEHVGEERHIKKL